MVCYSLEKQIIYIHVPKTGGMSIERILIDNFGFQHFTFKNGPYEFLKLKEGQRGFLRYIMKYSSESKEYNLKSWRKFTFVRHPCSRIVSGIRYLHSTSNDDFPLNLYDFYKKCQDDPFWYIHIIMSQSDTLKDLDGNISYDFIGKFENFKDDLEYVLFELFNFEKKDISNYHVNKSDEKILEFNKEITDELSTCLHEEDFITFNYKK